MAIDGEGVAERLRPPPVVVPARGVCGVAVACPARATPSYVETSGPRNEGVKRVSFGEVYVLTFDLDPLSSGSVAMLAQSILAQAILAQGPFRHKCCSSTCDLH